MSPVLVPLWVPPESVVSPEMVNVRSASPVVTVNVRSAVRFDPDAIIRSCVALVSRICSPVFGKVSPVVSVSPSFTPPPLPTSPAAGRIVKEILFTSRATVTVSPE